MTAQNSNNGLNGQNSGHNGRIGSQHRWEITRLRRVSSTPVAWKGSTRDGLPVHVSYCHGNLRIEIAEPSRTYPGASIWRDLLVVRPDYIELELDLLRQRSDLLGNVAGSLDATRRERRAVADWFILGECKSDRRVQTPRMTFWRMRSVLQARDERLDYLLRVGAAGAPVRVVVTTLVEDNPLPGEASDEEQRLFRHNGETR